jgi:hypothetical protein
MGVKAGPKVVKDGLVFALDAAVSRSYSGSGFTIYDLRSGTGATLINGVGYSSVNSGYFSFDGTNDYINFGKRADLQTNNITLSTWVKLSSMSYSDGAIILGWTDGANWPYGICITSYAGYIIGYITTDSRLLISPPLNTWHNIVLTRNSDSNILYLNGIGVSQSTQVMSYASTNLLASGWGGPGYASYLNGFISQSCIYNRALTAQEVLHNYNTTKGRFR